MRAEPASLPGGRREPLRRLVWHLDSPAGLVAMFAVAFLIRVLIAPHAGFYGDLRLFQTWAGQLAEVGTQHFYDQGQFVDYPPGYLYVLWLTGKISATPGYLLLKLPAILADLGLAWIAGTLAARIAPNSARERFPVRALVAAACALQPRGRSRSARAGGRWTRCRPCSCCRRCCCFSRERIRCGATSPPSSCSPSPSR